MNIPVSFNIKTVPSEIIEILSNPALKPCVFIKSKNRKYLFTNPYFEFLFGKNLIGKTDHDITTDKKLINHYFERDDITLETEENNVCKEKIAPIAYPYAVKEAKTYKVPLYIRSDKPNAVLGIILAENNLFHLDANTIFSVTLPDFYSLLTQKTYTIVHDSVTYSFSKREILCIIGMTKGKSATEIGEELGVQMRTIEYYIQNMKYKLQISKKSDLISFFFDNNLWQKFVV